jgi:putative transposase
MPKRYEMPQRKPNRRPNFDYSLPVNYFVTMRVHQHRCLFGHIRNGKMFLAPSGEMLQYCWQGLFENFPNTKLDTFVIMPDHFHAIVRLLPQIDENQQVVALPKIIQRFKSTSTNQYIDGVNNDGWPAFDKKLETVTLRTNKKNMNVKNVWYGGTSCAPVFTC